MKAFWTLGVAVVLSGCVAGNGADTSTSREVTVDGARMIVTQKADTQLYGFTADADGTYSRTVVGQGRALLVSGAADQDMAVRAMGVFCGIAADPADWDTDYVHQFDGTQDFQFSGLCP
jgi:hypothetical protein